MKIFNYLIVIALGTAYSCTTAQLSQLNNVIGTGTTPTENPLSNDEVTGLQVLYQLEPTVPQAELQIDGFYKNTRLFIPSHPTQLK